MSGIGNVTLGVLNLRVMKEFYADALGFHEAEADSHALSLWSADASRPVITLRRVPDGRRYPSAPGLFHVAVLTPSREALGNILRNLVRRGYPIDGAADHLVSHALYLTDPEGNGVELYCDLPRDQWPWKNGELQMSTEPLDVDAIYAAGSDAAPPDPRTRVGHVHLQVSQLQRSGEFYRRVIGLDITQGSFPGALFLSMDGYHHHVGLNIWRSRNSAPAPEGAPGLQSFSLALDSKADLDAIASRASESGSLLENAQGARRTVVDPDGIKVHLLASA
jgi:catechol 2,3-dioxygenase